MRASAADLLHAVAEEMAAMRREMTALEALAGDLIALAAPAQRTAALTRVQALDDLGQRLEALAGVIRATALGEPPEQALSRVPLAALVSRLGGGPLDALAPSGDIHLFD